MIEDEKRLHKLLTYSCDRVVMPCMKASIRSGLLLGVPYFR